MAYSVQRVAGMTYERDPRDVVFLKSAGEAWINAKEVLTHWLKNTSTR